jgi:hypothetical protein
MSTVDPHDELRDLVAVYALDAVEPGERAAIEAHLETCPRCRADLRTYQETAAALAYPGGTAPIEIWDRIVASLGEVPTAPPPLSIGVSGERRRARLPLLVGAALAAAAVAVIAVLGVVVGHQAKRIDHLDATAASQAMFQAAVVASMQPGSRNLPLVSEHGQNVGEVVVTGSGHGWLIANGLSSLPASRTYQLWAIVAGQARSVGLLGPEPVIAAFTASPVSSALALTDERAGGAAAPTGTPVASATM